MCILLIPLHAQNLSLQGKITNSETKEPVPFANVYLKNTMVGTVSGLDGKFLLNYNNPNDSLVITAIGFRNGSYYVPNIKGKRLNVRLVPVNIQIKEVKIKPRKTRSHELLMLIHKHEKENNTYYFKGFEGEEYNRTSIMFTGIDSDIMESVVFKKTSGAFIKDTDSTVSVPVLIEERMNYFLVPNDGSDRITRKILEQQNGLDVFEGAEMNDITEEMTINQNFYKMFIPFLGKNFASPAAINARFYYKLWVSDSTMVDNRKRFRIDFRPKRKKDLAFKGYFWVEDSTFAITEMFVDLSTEANINYLRKVRMHNIYERSLEGKYYFKQKKTELVIDYTPGTDSLKKVTTYISKVSSYKNLKKTNNNFLDEDIIAAKINPKIELLDENQLNDYWAKARFIALDTIEQQIFSSIDTLKTNKFIQAFDKSVNMFLTGYWEWGKIDLGPFLDFYRYNIIESHRFTLALRTSKLFSKKYTIGGYLGIGVRDKKLKYGVNYRYKFNNTNYTVSGFDVWYDIRKIGHNENLTFVRENAYASGEDNIVSALTSRRPNDKLSEKRYAGVWLEHDWKDGITSKFKLLASKTDESPYVPFMHNNMHINSVYQFGGYINLRLSFKEKYLDEFFHRVYLGNKYPIFNINIEAGITQTPNVQNPYLKIHNTIKHKLRLGMGFFKYLIEAGKIFGTVPFTMLEIHRGNEAFGLARYNFNMLNYMEYASDQYINFHGVYNFGGLFFNHIPLLHRLNLREVVSFKAILGSLSNKHSTVLDYPVFMGKVAKPYAEVGVGLTNIGQYIRIEYIWRLTDRDKPDIVTQGLRLRFEASF